MRSRGFSGRRLPLLALAVLCALVVSAPHARAQGKLDARYTVTLAGLEFGKGAWVLEIGEDQYSGVASGGTTGLWKMLGGGKGTSAARGAIRGGKLAPASYATTVITEKKTDEIKLSIAAGAVKEMSATPPQPPDPERVEVTEANKRNIADPMSAAIYKVAGSGDLSGAEACSRTASIFDGRVRYDLTFSYKRTEKVKAEKGYAGPAAVCAVYFKPIAGHIPTRAGMKYLMEQRDMEIWMVPVEGTRVVAPYRFTVPTPLGMGILQATQFVATPLPSRANISQ